MLGLLFLFGLVAWAFIGIGTFFGLAGKKDENQPVLLQPLFPLYEGEELPYKPAYSFTVDIDTADLRKVTRYLSQFDKIVRCLTVRGNDAIYETVDTTTLEDLKKALKNNFRGISVR